MFICQIIASHGDGGLEKHVRELSSGLVAEGHRVLVVGDIAFTKTLAEGVESVSLNMRLSRHHPWLLLQLYLCLRRYPFDVIHAQANKAASMLAKVKWLLKPEAIATLHNVKSQFKVFQHFSNVICVSQYLANQLKQPGVEVIYNGIQISSRVVPSIDLHQQYTLPERNPTIIAVGRLVFAKGFDLLLEAIDGLDINLIIVGEGPERESLEQRIARLDQKTVARLIGHHDDPSKLMHAADGLVISSRREGFSYVLNEALMSGVNVLATDVPVANEVLPKPLIVPVGDVSILRNRLQTLLHTPSYWSELMKKAQYYSKNEMTVEQMTRKTVKLYQRIIKAS